MKVITTDGAILNLERFEALRLYHGQQRGGTYLVPILEEEVLELESQHPRTGFTILALSGLGRSDAPTETVVAQSATAAGILAVWHILRGVNRSGPFDLAAVIRSAELR